MRKIVVRSVLVLAVFSGTLSAPPFAPPACSQDTWTYYANHRSVEGVAIEGDLLWFTTTGGVVRYNKRGGSSNDYTFFSAFDGMAANATVAVAIDGARNKWFAHSQVDAGISVLDTTGAWRVITPRDGLLLKDGKKANTLFASGDSVWVGTESGVTLFVEGETRLRVDADDGLPSDNVLAIATLGEDTWIGTEAGLARLRAGAVVSFTTAQGLPNDKIFSLAVNPVRSELWVGTGVGVAIVRAGGDSIVAVSNTGLAAVQILELVFQDSTAWAGTEDAPHRWLGSRWERVDAGIGAADEVGALASAGRELWAGFIKPGTSLSPGVSRLSLLSGAPSWTAAPRLTRSPETDNFGCLDIDLDGNVWLTSATKRDGKRPGDLTQLIRFSGTSFNSYTTTTIGLTSNLPDIIRFGPDGRGWLGFWDIAGGLNRMNATETAVDTIRLGGTGGVCTGFPANPRAEACTGILVDPSGIVWGAFDFSGVIAFDPVTRNCAFWTTTDGLPANATAGRGPSANALAMDRSGRVWVGFGRGSGYAVRIDPRGTVFDKSDDEVVPFDATTSPLPNELVHAVEIDSLGRIWFATESGFSVHNPADSAWATFTQSNTSNLLNGSIRSFAFLPNGSALIGDNAGNVYTLREDLVTWGPTYNLQTVGFPGSRVSVIKYDAARDAVWFALFGGGLVRLDPGDDDGPRDPVDSTRVIVYPNPWVAADGEAELVTIDRVRDGATVWLYSLAGESVRTLTVPAGSKKVEWDLRNASGAPIASGVYLFIVRKNGVDTDHGKLAIIR